MKRLFVAVVACLALAVGPTFAAFHLMVIQEIGFGDPQDGAALTPTPDQRAQYVLLRMTSGGQTFTNGASLRVEDSSGNILGTFGTIGLNVANGGGACSYPACPAIVVGTKRADDLFPFAFDQVVTGEASRVALPLEGGRVCFVLGASLVDCVAWGDFDCTRSGGCPGANIARTGDSNSNGCDQNFGTPAAPAGGTIGRTLTRTAFSCAAKENSTQFTVGFPHPVNNAGANSNTDSDGDGLVDVLDCDDASPAFLWPLTDLRSLRGNPGAIFSYSQAATNGGGVTYDVVCGTLPALSGFADAACFVNDDTAGSVAAPAGDHEWCLVRPSSSAACGGTLTYGPGTSPALDSLCP